MSVSSLVHCIAVLFFHLSGVQTITPSPDCPAPCLCEKTSVFNCASLGLSTIPLHIPATAFSLDLSNNSLVSLAPLGSDHVYLPRLQRFWVGNNSLESLSLCWGRGVESIRTLTRRNRKCVSWAPNLQLLSAERNQLTYLPRGLGSVKALQVLQLSHNRISELGPADLVGCTQLREVYLRHNLINTVHPQAFKDLQKLKVLDLSYNLLTIIPMPAYLSLRNLNALVDVSDNKWRCDCNLKMIRRWLTFDSELGSPTWKVVCSSPSYHSGKDLLSLDESELSCPQPVYNTPDINTMTVDEGMELSLPCTNANQDLTEAHWWTPSGQVSGNQQILYISNITEQHAGLYICASAFKQEHVSVFHVHVRKRVHDTRLRREAQNVFNDLGEENVNMLKDVPAVRQVQQSRFALAVCLSVFITFIVAFVLGVVLRPYLDKLCVKIRKKRGSTASSNSRASSVVPQQYVNEGFSDTCEQAQEMQRSSRVSFGGVTEVQIERDVEYDVPVEDDQSGSTDDGVIYQNVQRNDGSAEMGEMRTEVPLREANEKIYEYPNAETDKVMEFEHIPDPDERSDAEEKSISSASSCFSEDRVVSYEVNATEQSVDSPTAITHPDTILEFTTDPFSGIPTFVKENMDDPDTDIWNDSGDSFSFTDGSPRLSSPVSHAVYDFPSFKKEMSVDEQPNRPSSSKSSESGESGDYPTEYTINPETDGESETSSDSDHSQKRKLSSPAQDITTEDQSAGTSAPFRQDTITSDPDVHMTFNHGHRFDDVQFTEPKKSHPFKITLDYKDEPLHYRVHPVYRTSQEVKSVLRTDSSDTSSSSDNEDKDGEYYPRRLEIKSEPDINSAGSMPVKNSGMVLNINYDNTSSSTDIEESSKARERRTFKGLSGLSALLFNRSETEPNKKPVQSPPKPANTDSRSLIGSLGLYFKRQPSADENITPTAEDDSLFATIGQAIDQVPKLKKRLAFSIADPQPFSPHGSTPKVEETFKYPVSSSMEDGFFEMIGEVSHPIPRVKRYLHFSAMLYPEAPTTAEEKIIHKVEPNTETRRSSSSSESDISAIIKEDDFFADIGASYEYLPKVKGYLQFSLSNNKPVTAIETESKKSNVKFDPSISDEDDFFGQLNVSLEKIPKVKRYVLFQFAPFPMTHTSSISNSLDVIPVLTKNIERRYSSESDSEFLPQPLYLPSKKTEATTQLGTEGKRKAASFEYYEPAADENNFFQKIGISVDGLPKIRRYILFTAPPPEQPPFWSINRQITLETTTKPEFWRSSLVAVKPDMTEGMFFEQIGPCLSSTRLPKVKRYIEFNRFDSHSPSSLKQTVIPVGSTKLPLKRPSYSSDDETNSSTSQDDFYERMRISLDNRPKVKRSLQFVQPEPPLSNHQFPSLNAEMAERQITLETTNKPEFWRSSLVSVEPVMAEGMFFELIGPCLSSQRLPKVKRYIEFIRTDSHSPSSLKQIVTPVGSTKLPSKRPSYSSDYDTNSSTSQDSFFEGMRISLDKPKSVQSDPQRSNHQFPSLKTEITERILVTHTQPKSSSSTLDKPNSQDDVFRQISPSIDMTPKVKRDIQFSQSEVRPPSQSSVNFERDVVTESRQSSVSTENIKPTAKESNFFKSVGVSVDRVPKMKQYLNFTQRHVSTESPPPFSKTEVTPQLAARVASSNTDSSSEEEDNSLKEMPTIKRPIQSKRSEPKSFTHTQTFSEEHNTIDEATSNTGKYNFFERIGASLDNLPKVKRSLHFAQSEPQLFNPTTSPSSVRAPKLNQVKAEPFSSTWLTSRTFVETVMSVTDRDDVSSTFDRLQRPKKALIFTHSDTNDQNQTHFSSAVHDSSSATNANTEVRLSSQITRPRKPLLFTRSDADVQSGNVFTSSETGLRQKSSISLPGNNEGLNSPDSSSDTESSSPEYETTSKLKSKLGDSATPTLLTDSGSHSFAHSDSLPKPRRHLVMNTEHQDSISDPIPDSSEGNDAKDYLRDSFVARRRQEQRRLMFQQKKRAMDGFSLSSQSFTSHDDEQEANSSVPSSSERTHSRMATETSDRGKNKDTAASEYESLSSKTLTSLRSKFTVNKQSDV